MKTTLFFKSLRQHTIQGQLQEVIGIQNPIFLNNKGEVEKLPKPKPTQQKIKLGKVNQAKESNTNLQQRLTALAEVREAWKGSSKFVRTVLLTLLGMHIAIALAALFCKLVGW